MSEFRDHWAEIEAAYGGSWLTSFVLPTREVADALSAAVPPIQLPFLTALPASSMHVTVQGLVPLPDPIGDQLPDLVDAVKVRLAEQETFDATVHEPVVGHGGVYFDVLPQERFAPVRDGVRQGMAGLIPLPEGARSVLATLGGGVRDRCWPDRVGRSDAATAGDRSNLARRCGRLRGTA